MTKNIFGDLILIDFILNSLNCQVKKKKPPVFNSGTINQKGTDRQKERKKGVSELERVMRGKGERRTTNTLDLVSTSLG